MLAALQQEDPKYLPRLMIRRVYGWGLDIEVQEKLGLDRIQGGAEFYDNLGKVRNGLGKKSVRVTAYGGHYPLNVPSTRDGMEEIWNGGERVWTEWRERIPVNLIDAQMSIVSEGLPLYTTGKLSRLLLGDLVRAGVVVPPTEVEMAKLVVDTNAGAYKSLKLLGCEHDMAVVLRDIHKLLIISFRNQSKPNSMVARSDCLMSSISFVKFIGSRARQRLLQFGGRT